MDIEIRCHLCHLNVIDMVLQLVRYSVRGEVRGKAEHGHRHENKVTMRLNRKEYKYTLHCHFVHHFIVFVICSNQELTFEG